MIAERRRDVCVARPRKTKVSSKENHQQADSAPDGKAIHEYNPLRHLLALGPTSVQTKLAVSPPDLLSEQEADKIAIVSMRLAETQTLRDFTNDGERDVKAVASGASTSGVLGTNMRLPVSRAMHTRKKRTQWPIWWFRA